MSDAESTQTTPVTPLDRMKQWVFDKLQKDVSLDDPAYNYNAPKRESLSGPVPRIVISEEATRSPRIPFALINKPSPLKRTWVNYDLESPATNISPTGVIKSPKVLSRKAFTEATSSQVDNSSPGTKSATGSVPKTWLNYSAHSPLGGKKSPRANSLPVTPHAEKPKEFWSANYKPDLESPLQKYPKRKTSASSLPLHSPVHRKCKAANYLESPTSSVNSAEFTTTTTDIPSRANSTYSCHSDEAPSNRRKANEPLRLIGSHNDLHTVQSNVEEKKPCPLNRNTAIARSWSMNLNIPNNMEGHAETKPECETIMNENENKRSNKRRRSSILSIICLDKDSSSEHSDHSDEETSANKQNAEETDDETLQVASGTQYVEKLYKGIPIGGLASMFEMNKHSGEWGSVKVRFQYFNKSRRFQVSLIRAKNIGRGRGESLRLYVKVCLMPGKLQKQTGQGFHETHNPMFYESFSFTRLKLGEIVEKRLRVKFYNKLGLLQAESLGEVIVPLFNYDLTADTITWLHLRRCRGQKVCITFYTRVSTLFNTSLKHSNILKLRSFSTFPPILSALVFNMH